MGDGRRLRNFAQEMGLELIPGTFPSRTEVRGNYSGFPFLLFIERKFLGSDSLNIYLTVPSEENLTFNIFTKTRPVRSMCQPPYKPVNTKYITFNKSFLVESNNPEIIEKILTEEVCSYMSGHPWKGDISMREGILHFTMIYGMAEDFSDATEALIKMSNIMSIIVRNMSGKNMDSGNNH